MLNYLHGVALSYRFYYGASFGNNHIFNANIILREYKICFYRQAQIKPVQV